MRNSTHLLVIAALAGFAALHGNGETKLRVVVPIEISERAAATVAGRDPEFTPVLMLEGLEVGEGEGFSFEVRAGPAQGSTELGPVLAVSGLEGRQQEKPPKSVHKVDLPIPLNRKSLDFLAGKKEGTIILKLKSSVVRSPLKVDRAFFLTRQTTS